MDIGLVKPDDLEGDAKKRQLNYLMGVALHKIPVLPWALLVDKWRWSVFSGEITKENYQEYW